MSSGGYWPNTSPGVYIHPSYGGYTSSNATTLVWPPLGVQQQRLPSVLPEKPKVEQTPLEWLDAQIEEVCALAR